MEILVTFSILYASNGCIINQTYIMKKVIFTFLILSLTFNSFSQIDSLKAHNYYIGLETALGYGAGIYQYTFNLKGGYLLSDHLILGIQNQFSGNSPGQFGASYFYTGIFSRLFLLTGKRFSPFIEGGVGLGFADFTLDTKYQYVFSPVVNIGFGLEYKISDHLHLELSTNASYFFSRNHHHIIPLQIGINYKF